MADHLPFLPPLLMACRCLSRRASRVLSRGEAISRRHSHHSAPAAAAPPDWDQDVLIVGGGIVGASLACRLAQTIGKSHGYRIGLVEGRPPKPLEEVRASPVPDPRVYSMTPASARFLEQVGTWQALGERSQPFSQMQVWESGGGGFIRFDSGTMGESCLGTIAENSVLQSSLFEKLQSLEKEGLVSLFTNTQVKAIKFNDDTSPTGPALVTLQDKDGNSKAVRVRLLVGADGGQSNVKKARGLASWGWDYGQRAVVCTVMVDGPADNGAQGPKGKTAYQAFLKDGPLALLPLWDNYSSIVWSTTPFHADRLSSLPEADFLHELNEALHQPVDLLPRPSPDHLPWALRGAVTGVHNLIQSITATAALNSGFQVPPRVTGLCTKRFGFDLRLEQSSAYIGPRVALVGDAAHRIHPMAGQGLNLGLLDAECLAEVVAQGVAGGQDIGSLAFLKTYESKRQLANLGMLGSLDALHRLYGTQAGPVRWLRNVGMGTLNGLGPIKSQVAKYAMGI